MRLAHASDLHGNLLPLLEVAKGEDPDLWVFTGDMFPNLTRGDRSVEVAYQRSWYAEKSPVFRHVLRGIPVLLVPGNHDFTDLADFLRRDGLDAQEVTPEGVVFRGLRFSGFGHIPYIAGEWAREAYPSQLRDLTLRTLASDPEVLLTHAPPDGILNLGGITPEFPGDPFPCNEALTSALAYRPHRIRAHFFGHAHGSGGASTERMGVRFYNGALGARVVEL